MFYLITRIGIWKHMTIHIEGRKKIGGKIIGIYQELPIYQVINDYGKLIEKLNHISQYNEVLLPIIFAPWRPFQY